MGKSIFLMGMLLLLSLGKGNFSHAQPYYQQPYQQPYSQQYPQQFPQTSMPYNQYGQSYGSPYSQTGQNFGYSTPLNQGHPPTYSSMGQNNYYPGSMNQGSLSGLYGSMGGVMASYPPGQMGMAPGMPPQSFPSPYNSMSYQPSYLGNSMMGTSNYSAPMYPSSVYSSPRNSLDIKMSDYYMMAPGVSPSGYMGSGAGSL